MTLKPFPVPLHSMYEDGLCSQVTLQQYDRLCILVQGVVAFEMTKTNKDLYFVYKVQE